jgi:hypothetical protein
MKLNESILKNLNESYDLGNVVYDAIDDLFKLKEMIRDGKLADNEAIIKEIDNILERIKENASEAW